MVYGNLGRLDYPTCKVIETENFIIINGITYDKKTLAKLSNIPLELGFFNLDTHKTCLAVETMHAITNRGVSGYYFWYSNMSQNEVCGARATITDSTNGNIEWTIFGDGVIKFDVTAKTFTVIRLPEQNFNASTKYPIYDCRFIYQDENWIYIAAHVGGSRQNVWNGISVNKLNGVAKFMNTSFMSSGTYQYLAEIVKVDSNTAYIYWNDLGTPSMYKYTFANGEMVANNVPITPIAASGNYSATMPSKIQKDGSMYYIQAGRKLVNYKFENDAFTKVAEEVFLTENKIKCKDFLMKKYSITEDNWNKEKAKYFIFTYTSVGSYLINRVFTLGDNDQFLGIVCTGGSETNNTKEAGYGDRQFIAIFKRNNPDTDPLDLTLVDYYNYTELFYSTYTLGPIMKLNPKTLYSYGTFGIMMMDLNADGKLTPKYYYNPNIDTFGFDRLGRIYVTNKTNNIVEMFTEKLPYSMEIAYENENDDFIQFNKNPVTKNIKVAIKNMFGMPVMGSFELACNGKAEFTQSASNIFRSATNASGEATVSIKIKEPTIVTVSKELLYNNELIYNDPVTTPDSQPDAAP